VKGIGSSEPGSPTDQGLCVRRRLPHPVGLPAGLCAEPQPDRAAVVVVQAQDALQSALPNLRPAQSCGGRLFANIASYRDEISTLISGAFHFIGKQNPPAPMFQRVFGDGTVLRGTGQRRWVSDVDLLRRRGGIQVGRHQNGDGGPRRMAATSSRQMNEPVAAARNRRCRTAPMPAASRRFPEASQLALNLHQGLR
jgi:hypothetical protein